MAEDIGASILKRSLERMFDEQGEALQMRAHRHEGLMSRSPILSV
jgi:hypothetical protein